MGGCDSIEFGDVDNPIRINLNFGSDNNLDEDRPAPNTLGAFIGGVTAIGAQY